MAVAATLGLMAAGGIVEAGSIFNEGKAAAAAANYRAAVARNMAKFSIEQGQVEEQQQRMKNNALKAQQRTNLAANGVEVNSGSALELQSSSEMLGELDAQTIRANARMRSAAMLDQAKLDEAEAKNAKRAGKIGALTSIIGSATAISGKWSQAKMSGMK